MPPERTFFESIQPTDTYAPTGYAPALRAGDTIYVAGQVARDREGQLVGPGDAAAQITKVLENLDRILETAGATRRHVVKVTTYLVDAEDAAVVSRARKDYFGTHRPPHTGLVVKELGGPEVRVELEAIVVLQNPG